MVLVELSPNFEQISISFCANALRKCMNLSLLPLSMSI